MSYPSVLLKCSQIQGRPAIKLGTPACFCSMGMSGEMFLLLRGERMLTKEGLWLFFFTSRVGKEKGCRKGVNGLCLP